MAKKTKHKLNGTILALAAIIAAALAIKILWHSNIRISWPSYSSAPRKAGGLAAFNDSLTGLKRDSLSVRLLSAVPDSGINYQISADRERSYILLNLQLSRIAGSCGLKLVSGEEDSKKQTLKLRYATNDSQAVNILIRRKRSEVAAVAAKPQLAIVLYYWPPKEAKTAQDYLNCPQVATLIIKTTVRSSVKKVLVALPLEPKGYPREDPGPGTILVDDSDLKIRTKMDQALKLYPKAAGFYALAGSRALEDTRVCTQVIKYCLQNDLLFMEPQPTVRSRASDLAQQWECRYVKPDMIIGSKDSRTSISAKLVKALAACRDKGRYVILAPASPVFIKVLKGMIGEKTKKEFDFPAISQTSQ